MKIVINSKENKKLLQNFPEDPYSDITILTQYSKLHLAFAYLSIDSEYFANLDPGAKEVDLSSLNEQPLLKVLKSLYGAQLVAYSVQQLFALYEIIQELQIEQYKVLLRESLQEILTTQKENPILNSIQMLQFCINNNILVQQMQNFHFDTKLKILQSSKNYLQLNKLSEVTLSSLLLDFHALNVEKGDQIINHILENYFNRKNIRPAVYFGNEQLQQLKNIWQKFHHKITVTSQFTSSSQSKDSVSLSNTVGNFSCGNSLGKIESPMRKSQTNLSKMLKAPLQTVKSTIFKQQNLVQNQNQLLDQKIQSLEDQLRIKDDLIIKLRLQLRKIKQSKPFIDVDSDHEDGEVSLLLNLKKSKKSKQVAITNLDNAREVESFEASRDFNNVARNFGKNVPNKRVFQEGSK